MTRDLLQAILGRSHSVEESKKAFDTKEGHELSFYLGTAGQAIVVGEVKRIVLEPNHVELSASERRTFFVPYDAVISLVAKAPRSETESPRKTGFA